MSAAAAVVPERGFGITALANVDACRLPQALIYHAIDSVIFSEPGSRLEEFLERERFGRERLVYAEEDRKKSLIPGTKPSRPLDAYAGVYEETFYGRGTVTLRDGRLHLSFIGFEGPLDHWQLDTFRHVVDDPYLTTYKPIVRFELDDFGEPSQLTLVLLGTLRIKLQRKSPEPQPIALPVEKLRSYQGRFASTQASLGIVIELVDDALKVTIPGSLAGSSEDVVVRALIPVAENRLAIASTQAVLCFDAPDTVELEIPHQLPVRMHAAQKGSFSAFETK